MQGEIEQSEKFGIEDVVNLVGIKVVRNTGAQLHCKCPFCDDKKAHLNVKISQTVFRCNRCGRSGRVLHLYAPMHDVSMNTAYDELYRIFNYGEESSHEARSKQAPVVVKPELPLASTEVRDNTYSNLLSFGSVVYALLVQILLLSSL